MAAEKNLKACWDSIVDEQNLVAALTHANTALLAVHLLMIDIEAKLRDLVTSKPLPKKAKPKVEEESCKPATTHTEVKPHDGAVAAWVWSRYGTKWSEGTDLQKRGWRANYVIAQRKEQEEQA
jgi:hypothetical protein